MSGYPMDRALA